MVEKSNIPEQYRRPIRILANTLMVGGVIMTSTSIGYEARRINDGYFCEDQNYTKNRYTEEELKQIPDCAPDIMNGMTVLLGGISITIGGVLRKKTKS